MWSTIFKYALKIALYAAGHPDKVVAAVEEVKAVKEAVKGEKK